MKDRRHTPGVKAQRRLGRDAGLAEHACSLLTVEADIAHDGSVGRERVRHA